MDAVTGSPGKTQPFLVKGMEACVRVRWSRAKPFSSRLPLRPSVRLPRSPPARSLGGIQNFCLSLTRLLTRPMRVPPRARAPAPHGPTSPSLPPCRPPSISVISKSAVLAARRARARSGDAVWKVISVLGPPSLSLSLSYLN